MLGTDRSSLQWKKTGVDLRNRVKVGGATLRERVKRSLLGQTWSACMFESAQAGVDYRTVGQIRDELQNAVWRRVQRSRNERR